MAVALRMFSETDREYVLAISRAIYPEYYDGSTQWYAALQFDDSPNVNHRYISFDAETKQIVGYGAIRAQRPDRYRLNLMVAPHRQRRGIGTMLYSKLLEEFQRRNGRSLQARVRSDKPAALGFLKKHGFTEVHRMVGLVLSVRTFDVSMFQSILERVAARNIDIATLMQTRRIDADAISKLHALYNRIIPDWPNDDPTYPNQLASHDEFMKRVEGLKNPSGSFIAIYQDAYVGYTGELGTWVHPDYRGYGLATALKAHRLEYARQQGSAITLSCTANPAMIAVNEKLGYQREFTEVRLIKRFDM